MPTRGQVFGFSKLAGVKVTFELSSLPANSEKPNTWPRAGDFRFFEETRFISGLNVRRQKFA
jgi:hypothetical protein